MWTDLHIAMVQEASDDGDRDMRICTEDFLNILEWLKCYKQGTNHEVLTGLSSKALHKCCWWSSKELQALEAEKVAFPEPVCYPSNTVWIMTTGSSRCNVYEPWQPKHSHDKEHLLHKKGHAGWSYDLGICLWSSNLIWMNGPFKAGKKD